MEILLGTLFFVWLVDCTLCRNRKSVGERERGVGVALLKPKIKSNFMLYNYYVIIKIND